VKSPLQRAFTVLWRRPRVRRWFYSLLGLAFRGRPDWRLMNCGYLPAGDPLPDLPPDWENERLGFELYARVVAETPLAGLDVLEVGSGRGGGARFLHRLHAPRRVVAADYAAPVTRWCRKRFAAPGLEFVTASATALPFPARSFDVMLAVELSHCLRDKPAFLREAARVLRPGGRLLLADFFYLRPDSAHARHAFDEAVAHSAFTLVRTEDLTARACAAIEADSARRIAAIEHDVPRVFRGIARGFAGTTESSTYRQLRDGRAVYLRYVLARSPTP
jgi:SAM-dependent methyltransferase